jgi:L-ascorbate metabolism protein UlaG (beta-lactamase superfamily)
MRVRRLGWAGLEIQVEGETAVLDLLRDIGSMARWIGDPRGPLLAPDANGRVLVALVTHLHSDHTDPAAIAEALAPDGVVLRPPPAVGEGLEVIGTSHAERGLAERAIATRVVEPWEAVHTGPFALTAVPAVDGFGDPQIGWVIAGGGATIVAYGDTIFHGSWWLTKMRHGPFDAAFLPVNGAVVDLPHRQPPSPLHASMNPEQAAAAASLLEAEVAIPVHYDTLFKAPAYIQVDDPAGSFERAAGEQARVLQPGDWVELGGYEPTVASPSSRDTRSA